MLCEVTLALTSHTSQDHQTMTLTIYRMILSLEGELIRSSHPRWTTVQLKPKTGHCLCKIQWNTSLVLTWHAVFFYWARWGVRGFSVHQVVQEPRQNRMEWRSEDKIWIPDHTTEVVRNILQRHHVVSVRLSTLIPSLLMSAVFRRYQDPQIGLPLYYYLSDPLWSPSRWPDNIHLHSATVWMSQSTFSSAHFKGSLKWAPRQWWGSSTLDTLTETRLHPTQHRRITDTALWTERGGLRVFQSISTTKISDK